MNLTLVVAALLVATTACGSAAIDRPLPATRTGEPSLPPRPREIRMDGLDPCAVVPPTVLSQLGMSGPGKPRPGEVAGISGCLWNNFPTEPDLALGTSVTVNQDTAHFLGLPDSTETSVAGFGAVDMPNDLAGAQYSCVVRIDVAPSEGLWVSVYNASADMPDATHEAMCRKAHVAAEGIMRDLLSKAN